MLARPVENRQRSPDGPVESRRRSSRVRVSRGATRAGAGRGHPGGRPPGGRGPDPRHALRLHAIQGRGRLARAGQIPARAGPGERRPVADAGEGAAQRPRLRQDRTGRLLRREGLLREPSRVLRHWQPLPTAREDRSVSRGPLAARPLGLWPPRERRRRLDPRAVHLARAAGLRGLLVGHGRLQRLSPGGPSPPRPAPGAVGDRIALAPPLEQHPLGGLPGVAPGRGQEPPCLHGGLRRRHPDLPADRGRRPDQGLRPGEHDLALHAGRRRLRERAEPASRHEQHGDRGAHGATTHADGLGGRRLDAGHAPHRVPRGRERVRAAGGEGQGGDRPVHRRPQLQPGQPRGGLRLVRAVAPRTDRRVAGAGAGVHRGAAGGPARLPRARPPGRREDAGADRGGADRGPKGAARGAASARRRGSRSLPRGPRPRLAPRAGRGVAGRGCPGEPVEVRLDGGRAATSPSAVAAGGTGCR